MRKPISFLISLALLLASPGAGAYRAFAGVVVSQGAASVQAGGGAAGAVVRGVPLGGGSVSLGASPAGVSLTPGTLFGPSAVGVSGISGAAPSVVETAGIGSQFSPVRAAASPAGPVVSPVRRAAAPAVSPLSKASRAGFSAEGIRKGAGVSILTGRTLPGVRESLAGLQGRVSAGLKSGSALSSKTSQDVEWDGLSSRNSAGAVSASPTRGRPASLRRSKGRMGLKHLFGMVPLAAAPAVAEAASSGWLDRLLDLFLSIPEWGMTAIEVTAVLGATWLAARLLRGAARWVFNHTELDPLLEAWMTRGAYVLAWIAGGVTALGMMGVSATALATSAGAWSIALGLAVKDTITNIVSGLVLFFNRPFKVGDRIRVLKEEGRVAGINTRFLTLDTSETMEAGFERVLIPNTKLLNEKIYGERLGLLGGLAFLGAWQAKLIPIAAVVGKAAAILFGTYLTARLFKALARRALKGSDDEARANWMVSMAGFGAWLLGALVMLNFFGVTLSALVTSLGIVSVGVAFAMKDFANNLVAGLMMAVYRPFHLGDTVKIAGDIGRVVDITHRYVRLEIEDEAGYRVVNIPNSKLMNDKIYTGRKPEPEEEAAK